MIVGMKTRFGDGEGGVEAADSKVACERISRGPVKSRVSRLGWRW